MLPTSALQGLPLAEACRALLRLRPDNLQLCPGNLPSPGMEMLLGGALVHHGFSWTGRQAEVWDAAGEPLVPTDQRTLHPPTGLPEPLAWLQRHAQLALETMPPGALLGDADTLNAAMDLGIALAVDLSHLHLQRTAGALDEATLRRLFGYDRVVEVHLSDNDGARDLHRPPGPQTFGAAWAREKSAAGTPLILECRMHTMDDEARRRLVEAWR